GTCLCLGPINPSFRALDAARGSWHRGDAPNVAKPLRQAGFPSDLNDLAGRAVLPVSESRFPSQNASSPSLQTILKSLGFSAARHRTARVESALGVPHVVSTTGGRGRGRSDLP